jgi:hypothetical protein
MTERLIYGFVGSISDFWAAKKPGSDSRYPKWIVSYKRPDFLTCALRKDQFKLDWIPFLVINSRYPFQV